MLYLMATWTACLRAAPLEWSLLWYDSFGLTTSWREFLHSSWRLNVPFTLLGWVQYNLTLCISKQWKLDPQEHELVQWTHASFYKDIYLKARGGEKKNEASPTLSFILQIFGSQELGTVNGSFRWVAGSHMWAIPCCFLGCISAGMQKWDWSWESKLQHHMAWSCLMLHQGLAPTHVWEMSVGNANPISYQGKLIPALSLSYLSRSIWECRRSHESPPDRADRTLIQLKQCERN